jgi:sigma-B regulation protein RsbU (phosphoserine phosphatase)
MGGDFYDIFVLPDGRLAVLIADVTGKGIPAAFYSALVLSHIKALCARYRSPRTIGAKTNRFLFDLDPDSTMFVTMFLGILDQKTGKLTYVSAGHEPAILLRRDRRIELLESKGLMLGIFEESILKQKTVILEPNDLLVVYTDGLTDAHDEKKNRLDREKIERLLLQKNPQSAQRAVDLLVKFVTDHSQNAPQFDDITILTVYRES